jgi:hypothetical protein
MTFISQECPLEAELVQASALECENVTGQILGMALQLASENSEFSTLADIQAGTNWNNFEIATGASKLVYTYQFSQGLLIPNSERNEVGVDSNDSVFGVGTLNGRNTVLASGMMYGLDGEAISALDAMAAQSTLSKTRLRAYFIMEGKNASSGRVKCSKDGLVYKPIPIYNLSFSSGELLGFNTKDVTKFEFRLRSDWDRQVVNVDDLDFNPIDKLI